MSLPISAPCSLLCRLLAVLDFFFFFNDTATTEIYTLSLHDALPISISCWNICLGISFRRPRCSARIESVSDRFIICKKRSEEHTSELQSHLNLVCRLLLEKKKDPEIVTHEQLPGVHLGDGQRPQPRS